MKYKQSLTPTLTKLSGNCPSKPSLASKRHAAHILTFQEAKTTVDCPICLGNITNNLVQTQTVNVCLKYWCMKAVKK